MGISILLGLGRLRPSLALISIICCLGVSAWAEEETRHSFDIPASMAMDSLKLVARQGGVEIVFDSRVVTEVRTPAIRGSFTPLQAFQLLLKDTSLAVFQDAETAAFAVYRKSGAETNTSDQVESSLPTLGIAGTSSKMSGQDDPSDDYSDFTELEKFVVTGYRASLLRASKLKKNANQVMDAVSAEDIGKLPDPTVADALQRITGIQLTRQDNEGREVSVRGLSSFLQRSP